MFSLAHSLLSCFLAQMEAHHLCKGGFNWHVWFNIGNGMILVNGHVKAVYLRSSFETTCCWGWYDKNIRISAQRIISFRVNFINVMIFLTFGYGEKGITCKYLHRNWGSFKPHLSLWLLCKLLFHVLVYNVLNQASQIRATEVHHQHDMHKSMIVLLASHDVFCQLLQKWHQPPSDCPARWNFLHWI
jgi:hypothetical protein